MKDIIILAIETSCDETSAAVIKNGREILSNVVYTQIDLHQIFGGVVPEIASRKHIEKVDLITMKAMEDAGLSFNDLTAIAVTHGPGLVGALLVGLSYAKGLAYALGIPLIPVNHIDGHIAANYLAFPELEPPYISLIVSGGHSHIVRVKDYGTYEVIGRTRDDAVGEAFDKVARTLGFGYPGGPVIDRRSRNGNKEAIHFTRTYLEKDSYDFSFSGIKSGVLNYINSMNMKQLPINHDDVAASFQEAVVEVLVEKITRAASNYQYKTLVIAGGVAANSRLREWLSQESRQNDWQVLYPPLDLCTDNAAMIGAAAYYSYLKGIFAELDLNAVPNLKLSPVDNIG
jgi:N6-L-threonylcarbamoyladenine synthase